ncbi:MAG TPA: energy transducer TonB, partial [Thiobacillus sp.]|nr:energy transducer TonB [Thiobacillus sp.]
PMSRRLGETGKVVLRVELDETGRVSTAQVASSSGSTRLDAAALAAVRSWRCNPAQRDGQAVRSVATQPFNFTLEGR